MQLCKNCSTINEDHTDQCVKCKMRGKLVPYEGVKQTVSQNIKPLYSSCSNCGTLEHGNGSKCIKCNFPLKYKKVENRDKEAGQSDQKSNLK